MSHFMLLLHVIGALGLGYYLLLPFLFVPARALTGSARSGYFRGLHKTNLVAMYFLVVQLLTGGYLVSQNDYTPLWMILAIVLLIAVGALTGIMGKRMKIAARKMGEDGNADRDIAAARLLSVINGIVLLVIVILMVYPAYK